MDIEIRTITEQEIPAYGRSLERAFSEHWTEQDWKVEHNVFEVERSLAAFDAVLGNQPELALPARPQEDRRDRRAR